jgi:predicted MFS family arabinose efflux permease
VAGGLIGGVAADAIDYRGAIALVAALTAASGLWVMFDMPGARALADRERAQLSPIGGGS